MKIIKNYPRPQFVRENWLNLNGEWNFIFDDQNIGETQKYYNNFPKSRKIQIPFTYETKLSGINDQTIHENIWYQKNINIQSNPKKESIILYFEGSDFITKVWINGNYIGKNIGGYHRFSFNITNFLINGENNFTIKVEDSLSKSQPRGKQRYKKESWKCWYVQTTGIWKTIWLEKVSKNYIISCKNTPNFDEKNIEIELLTNISNSSNTFEIETEISFNNEIINSQKSIIENNNLNYNIDICSKNKIHEIKYWSHKHPYLYDITYKLYCNGILIDKVYSYFGIRKISIEGNKILLNNEELYLKMILDQGYWANSHLTPPNENSLIEDIKLVKNCGFNGIRKHQKNEDERFLYYCDINGILVWNEMANCYIFNDKSIAYFMDEWIKVVQQNYNHPSIITWVPINESWGIPNVSIKETEQDFANSLYYVTKAIDKTRPVIANDGWEHTLADIITIHDYVQDGNILYEKYNDELLSVINNKIAHNGKHKLFSANYSYNGQPIIMSEYGGIALNSTNGWGYGTQVKGENEFLKRYKELTAAIKNTKYITGYCYTQLSDVQQEINGLVDENRNDKFSDEIIDKIKKINEDDRNLIDS